MAREKFKLPGMQSNSKLGRREKKRTTGEVSLYIELMFQ